MAITKEIYRNFGCPEPEDFRGLAPEAMHFIASDRCCELIALQDLNLAFEAALIKMLTRSYMSLTPSEVSL